MNKFMWKNMQEINNSNRPEQMLLYKILKERSYIKDGSHKIATEYEVTNLKPYKDIPAKNCILDIVIIENQCFRTPDEKGWKIAIRLMGEIHKGSKYKRRTRIKLKDEDQAILLHSNGWVVKDIDKEKFPELWDRPNISKTSWIDLVGKRISL